MGTTVVALPKQSAEPVRTDGVRSGPLRPRPGVDAMGRASMRVLVLNKYLYPKGGAETQMLLVGGRLAQSGHRVRYVGMDAADHAITVPTAGTVPEIDYRRLERWTQRIASALGGIYSPTAYRVVARAVRRERPHVAHLHNIYHQLSPSVLVALRRAGVPVVMTAHDYKLVCPTYLLSSPSGPCFRCRHGHYWEVLRAGCSPHGRAASLFYMLEAYVHRVWGTYARHVDLVLAPSRFLRDRLVEGGWPAHKVRLMPNPIPLDQFHPAYGPGEYLLFIGRLSAEKGLRVLLDAADAVPDVPLWVAGDGPLHDELSRRAAARGGKGVRLLGHVPHEKLVALVRGCRAVVLPSRSPENCPVSVLEAFACGKPVVASRIGGIPELVEPSGGGWLVQPDNVSAWSTALSCAWGAPRTCVDRGRAGRAWVEAHHNLDAYCRELVAIYSGLLEKGGAPCESR